MGGRVGREVGSEGGWLAVPAAHHLARLLPGSGREMCLIRTQVIGEPRHSCGSWTIMNRAEKKNKKDEKVGGARAWPSFPTPGEEESTRLR